MDQLAATKLELDHYLKRYKPRKVKTFQLRKEQLRLSCKENTDKIIQKSVEFQVNPFFSSTKHYHIISQMIIFYNGMNKLLLSLKCKMFVKLYSINCFEIKILLF